MFEWSRIPEPKSEEEPVPIIGSAMYDGKDDTGSNFNYSLHIMRHPDYGLRRSALNQREGARTFTGPKEKFDLSLWVIACFYIYRGCSFFLVVMREVKKYVKFLCYAPLFCLLKYYLLLG